MTTTSPHITPSSRTGAPSNSSKGGQTSPMGAADRTQGLSGRASDRHNSPQPSGADCSPSTVAPARTSGVSRGLTAQLSTKRLQESTRLKALSMLDRFRVMRTLDVAVVCFPERPFKAALTAAQRAVRGMVKDGLIRRYRTDRFQTIYGLSVKGAAWLHDHGREQATSSVRRTSDMTNPEHRLWLQLLVLAAEARGLSAETEQEMLSRINRGRNPMAAMIQGPLKVYVTSNGRTEGKTLRPDALFKEPDGATWVEVDRSKRGSDREAGLRALALAVGSDLIDSQLLRRVVVFCKSERIQGRALAVLRALAREQSEKVLVSGRRQFKETSDGVFEVTAAQEVKLSDGRVMEKPVVAGHVLVQALPTWLPKVRVDAQNRHRMDGWLTDDYLPYRRAGCGAAWPPIASPLLASGNSARS